jgi:hypothetical protein
MLVRARRTAVSDNPREVRGHRRHVGFRRSVATGIRVVRIRLGQAIRDNRPIVGELTSDTVPGKKQSAFGEVTTGGHLALRGVRLLEREKL